MGWEALSHKDMETLRSLATGQGAWRSAHVPARYATCLPYINPSKEDMEELLLDDLRRFIKDEMASKFLENRLDYFFSILGLGQQIFFQTWVAVCRFILHNKCNGLASSPGSTFGLNSPGSSKIVFFSSRF